MTDSEHIKWLLEGVESWNARRMAEDFTPRLEGEAISLKFRMVNGLGETDPIPLAGINFEHANLKDTYLDNADLSGAILTCAELDGADLMDTKLCNAKLNHASLKNANLRSSDLSNSNFEFANLHGANLSSAKLKNAILDTAHLTNTILHRTSLNEAKIFSTAPFESGNEEEQIQGITCIENLLGHCRRFSNRPLNHKLYFRGESKNEWELRPSLMRQSNLGEREGNMLRDLKSRRPEDFSNMPSALAEWVLAQHHGLRTRLLDITRNPLVALFWACHGNDQEQPGRLHVFSVPKNIIKSYNSDIVSVIANFAKLSQNYQKFLLGKNAIPLWHEIVNMIKPYQYSMDVLYEQIQQEKYNFKERIDPRDFFRVFVVEPQQSFDRIRVQSGAFLISAYHERFERNEILKVNPDIPVYDHLELEIPHESKHKILKDLALFNITMESLMPGLEEAARAVNSGE